MDALPTSTAAPIVFIVDDDVSVRESLELFVRNENWRPETFASAQEFLNYPRKLAPSCLVLDLSLPGLNGLELQKQLAAEHIDMPIIFITGFGDVPKSVQAMKGGALEFLTKPLNDALISAIRNALQRSRLALPGSLAIISTSFDEKRRGQAIGSDHHRDWSGSRWLAD